MEIQDFGEKIGGAKKDLWKERGLSVDDIIYMNDAEKKKLIKKDNIWKKPKYQEMVDNGLPVRVAYFIKKIRDAIPTQPTFYTYNTTIEEVNEEYEKYIDFVSHIRNITMNLSSENEVLDFYNNNISEYIIHKPNSYYIEVAPEAKNVINNKFLEVCQIKNFNNIDKGIRKTKFCYNDEEKVLADFNILLYDNDLIKFDDDSKLPCIKFQSGYGTYYFYPENELSDKNIWIENTYFIMCNRNIIKNNFKTENEAKEYILENYKETGKSSRLKNRKKRFIPKQLENIVHDGEDYRENRNISGEDMQNTFNFKGGEFGNWLNDNDRQQSLNYGYDALLDLSKALSITPEDISLGGKLSIAFGSRGSGNALAHYEPDREVINLTKMKGAGSLAHEWGHALDDIIGKNLGCNGFITENHKHNDTISDIINELISTMKYKEVSGSNIIEKQVSNYKKQTDILTSYIDSLFKEKELTDSEIKEKNNLIQKLIDTSDEVPEKYSLYMRQGNGNKELDELSNFRKNKIGRVISKDDRLRIINTQFQIANQKSKIGKPEKVKTDFYKNSITFDESYVKAEHGYWQSEVEMFARSFACYVSDKLNYRSDYLCGHANMDICLNTDSKGNVDIIKAFPEGEERKNINEKLDKLIEHLKEKEILHDNKFEQELDDFVI